MNTIDLSELKRRHGELVVAEVLPTRYYREGHLPGAVHLPLDSLSETAAEVIQEPEREVVVYCAGPTCENSRQAAQRLSELGYRGVRVFLGGKQEWTEAELPLEVV